MLSPDSAPAPLASFEGLGLAAPSLRVVHELGYTQPTPIQAQAIPVLLAGRDLVGQSATGSGKTVAFGLPMLERLDLQETSVQALVLCPTRELAAQVGTAIRTLGRHRPGLRVLVVAGGQPSGPQRKALDSGVHVVVGTPGRVLDLLAKELDFNGLRIAVLDEADRMLDMGFLPTVEKILTVLPKERQTLLFSATMPGAIAAMSRTWMRSPQRVTIAGTARTKPQIQQIAHHVTAAQRPQALLAVLAGPQLAAASSVLIFCNFKDSVRQVAADLAEEGHSVDALHGDLEQRDRDRVLAKFRNGSKRVLVATDVAARGLDIAGIDAVINFELPPAPEVYVHRIGRTGRAGAPGLAISLATSGDAERLAQAAQACGGYIEPRPLPERPVPPAGAGRGKASKEAGPAAPATAEMATLLVRAGRKDKLRAGDILGALSGEGGCAAADIGRIEIHDEFSYVAVTLAVSRQLIALGRLRIKGKTVRIEPLR